MRSRIRYCGVMYVRVNCFVVRGCGCVSRRYINYKCLLWRTYGGEVMNFGSFCFRGELGFLNCDAICMGVVNKQFELLKFVFDSVYVDLHYNEIYLTFTAGFVWCV